MSASRRERRISSQFLHRKPTAEKTDGEIAHLSARREKTNNQTRSAPFYFDPQDKRTRYPTTKRSAPEFAIVLSAVRLAKTPHEIFPRGNFPGLSRNSGSAARQNFREFQVFNIQIYLLKVTRYLFIYGNCGLTTCDRFSRFSSSTNSRERTLYKIFIALSFIISFFNKTCITN